MPVVKYPRKGRPRRSRFISKREIAIMRHKRKFREKSALQSDIVNIDQSENNDAKRIKIK